MSLFGGYGVMEDFSSLPRLYRDSAVNELWEGPRNVLITKIHRDIQKASSWYRPGYMVKDIFTGADPGVIKEYAGEIESLTAYPNLFTNNEKTKNYCRRWDGFCERFTHAYQDLAVDKVKSGRSSG